MLEPASEFRKSSTLQPLLSNHIHWGKIEEIITNGITYPLSELPESTRVEDLKYMIKRGNHKSAKTKENAEALEASYTREVEHGWMLPVTVECLSKLKGVAVIPVGCAEQFSTNENGERIIKRRTTHDTSFPPIVTISK